ncbi:hypothetical protein MJO28_011433 [Puccinia striiformis f. sp. tritici]|uniref:Uncharacterized protein n=1 Tax=Puccinia striiformis f. sp. tritici TaxID=168172 RepID=A0ACC0E246_9BASI|nr:hypothetical protein MJO28_011433 [Puccinia striiformis f. sp. tritici]
MGPVGGPGMPEMLKPSSMIMGAGLGNDVACLTDSRFSGGYSQLHIFNFSFHNPTDRPHLTPFRSHGFCISHIVPKAVKGGPIGLLKDGDQEIRKICKYFYKLEPVMIDRPSAVSLDLHKAGANVDDDSTGALSLDRNKDRQATPVPDEERSGPAGTQGANKDNLNGLFETARSLSTPSAFLATGLPSQASQTPCLSPAKTPQPPGSQSQSQGQCRMSYTERITERCGKTNQNILLLHNILNKHHRI